METLDLEKRRFIISFLRHEVFSRSWAGEMWTAVRSEAIKDVFP